MRPHERNRDAARLPAERHGSTSLQRPGGSLLPVGGLAEMGKDVTTSRIPSIPDTPNIPDVSKSVDICYVGLASGSVRVRQNLCRTEYVVDEPRPCTKCGRLLPRTPVFYAPDTRSADGLHSWCRGCQRKKALRWAETHRERAKVNARKHYRENRPRYQEAFRSWAKAHPSAITAHAAVEKALESGRMVMPDTCDVCEQKLPVLVHHEDYTRPLWGTTVCLSCHKKEHGCRSAQNLSA